MSDVKLLAAWDGWCDPCATERPLVLVEVGPRGVKAWLGGVGIEDRTLSLTCRVCGQWQLVPQLEEDDEPVEDVVTAPAAEVEQRVDPVLSPLLASALIPVRTAAFDESGRTVAASAAAAAAEPAAPIERPRTRVELLEEEPPVELAAEPAAPRTRWFSRKPAVNAEAEADVEAHVEDAVEVAVEAPVAAVEDVEPAATRTRWFSRKPAVESEVEDEDVVEAPVAEVEDANADADAEPRTRWFTRRTTVEQVGAATTVTPIDELPIPAPRKAIVPDVEEPVRPHKVNPAAVRPLPQTRAVPVPRTYRSPVRVASATDTSPLALLAAGYDVVAAGAH